MIEICERSPCSFPCVSRCCVKRALNKKDTKITLMTDASSETVERTRFGLSIDLSTSSFCLFLPLYLALSFAILRHTFINEQRRRRRRYFYLTVLRVDEMPTRDMAHARARARPIGVVLLLLLLSTPVAESSAARGPPRLVGHRPTGGGLLRSPSVGTERRDDEDDATA